MELVYVFIENNPKNIFSTKEGDEKNHLEINLGSEKKFKTINFNSDEILIETSINENFIPNYFNDDNKLKNITPVFIAGTPNLKTEQFC